MTTTSLTGKVALVTGGGRGIGAAIAVALAEHGADVAVTYQRESTRAAGVVERIEAFGRRGLAIQADSSDPGQAVAAVERTVEELGRLDVLVNNAGISMQGPLEDMSLADVDRTLDVNVRAPFLAAQAAAPHLPSGGTIITIGSNTIERTPLPGLTLYSTSKAALLGLTKGLARDLAPLGVTANLVSPGPIDTELNPADGPHAHLVDEMIPLGRFGSPEDVAATVVHLAAPTGRHITGANVAIDGGLTA